MRRDLIPPWRDAALAAGVAVVAILEVSLNAAIVPKTVAAPTELAFALALAWRRRFPLAVAVIGACCFALEAVLDVPLVEPVAPLIALVIAVYSFALYAGRRAFIAGLGAFLAADAISVTTQHKGIGNFVFGLTFTLATAFVGRAMRGRVRETEQLELLAEGLERERVEAIAEERARIARELHDVIAHSVSVMVVQAGAAEEVLKSDPARAVEPIRAVQDTGRQALVEMKRLVGMLREHDDELGLDPQPGIASVEELAAQMRDAGLPVALHVEGEPRPLPLGVDLSAYRVVQEALTNALKHAGSASVSVAIRYGPEALVLEIADDGSAPPHANGTGHGLAGMRERVAVFEGEFEAGPVPGGGFVVRARLPVHA